MEDTSLSGNLFLYEQTLALNRPYPYCYSIPMKISLRSLAEQISKLEKKVSTISSLLPEPAKPSRFTDNGDGTVTDKETNLTWMKQDDGKCRKWEEAKKYCESNEAKLPGEGWRLPTVKELISLVDYDKHSPAIDPLFLGTKSSYYWSSTTYAYDSVGAWYVSFSNGYVNWFSLVSGHYVRPVRQNS